MQHRKTRKTLEIHYSTTYIHNIALEQFHNLNNKHATYFFELEYNKWIEYRRQLEAAKDRWVYAPDRWHNCPSHRLNKETPTRYRATFLASYHNNKPDDWSELRWYNYLLKLWEKKF